MLLQLPKRFKMGSIAEVKEDKLYIYRLVRFEDLMYELTYAFKKRKCVYCGNLLSKKNSTLDHRYPRFTGGISITNNLFPCCPDCNSKKGCLTHEEYLKLKTLKGNERRTYLKKLAKFREKIFKKIGFKLPKKWITYMEIDKIKYNRPNIELRGKKYYQILEFYNQYNKLPYPCIIDNDNNLLNGYNLILFAREFDIKTIPTIKLENVILTKRAY